MLGKWPVINPPDGQHCGNSAVLQSRPPKGVISISVETIATLIIGVLTLMIAFAMLILKIVEVSRSK